MAFPASPTIDQLQWDGYKGSIHFHNRFAGAEDGTSQIVDLSADLSDGAAAAPNSVKITRVTLLMRGDLRITLAFDATTDQPFMEWDCPDGATTFTSFQHDFTSLPNKGLVPSNVGAAGFTGDIVLTTFRSGANDNIDLLIEFEKNT